MCVCVCVCVCVCLCACTDICICMCIYICIRAAREGREGARVRGYGAGLWRQPRESDGMETEMRVMRVLRVGRMRERLMGERRMQKRQTRARERKARERKARFAWGQGFRRVPGLDLYGAVLTVHAHAPTHTRTRCHAIGGREVQGPPLHRQAQDSAHVAWCVGGPQGQDDHGRGAEGGQGCVQS